MRLLTTSVILLLLTFSLAHANSRFNQDDDWYILCANKFAEKELQRSFMLSGRSFNEDEELDLNIEWLEFVYKHFGAETHHIEKIQFDAARGRVKYMEVKSPKSWFSNHDYVFRITEVGGTMPYTVEIDMKGFDLITIGCDFDYKDKMFIPSRRIWSALR